MAFTVVLHKDRAGWVRRKIHGVVIAEQNRDRVGKESLVALLREVIAALRIFQSFCKLVVRNDVGFGRVAVSLRVVPVP